MTLRVGISAFAGDGGLSGLSTYLRGIVGALTSQAEQLGLSFVLYRAEDDRVLPAELPHTEPVSVSRRWAPPVANIAWHQLVLPWRCRADRLDLLFLPAGNRRMVAHAPCPVVATVHDLSPFHVQEKYDPARMLYVKRVLPWLLRRGDRLVSVSHSTARDLVELAGVHPSRIDVVHNGLDQQRFVPQDRDVARRRIGEALGFDAPYLLYLSRLEHPGKNHVTLIRAFAQLCERHPELPHRLLLIGADWNGSEQIHAAIASSPVRERILAPGFIDADLLPVALAGADTFVFPSRFEGFGLPAAEAMACGTPVVASNCSSLPEVVGDAGLLVDPDRADELALSIARTLHDRALRTKMIERGLSQARVFSWERAATEVGASFAAATGRLPK